MTAPRAFGPDELEGAEGVQPDDLVAETRVARDLEALAGAATVSTAGMSADFIDRVMASVDAEPVPAPARVAGLALRRGAFGAFLASFGDAWRVATRSGFPAAVRAQAFALVLVVAAFAAGSGVVAAGAVGLIRGDQGGPSPAPSLEAPSPVVAPTPSVSPAVESPSTEAPASPEPTPTDESPTAKPGKTGQPTATPDDNGGGGGGGDDHGGQRTPRPTDGGGDDNSGPGGGGGGGGNSGPGGGDDESGDDHGSGSGSGSGSGGDGPTETPDDD